MPEASDILETLAWRGLLFQSTEGAGQALARGPVTVYCGFDPTAPSLHVGNLIPVMLLVHLQRAGHRPVALIGGGTGMIGDPSGKTKERELNPPALVAANSAAIRSQLERFVDFDGPAAATMVDNADWLLRLGAVEFIRDVGKHFTINYMLAKDSVKSRLESGISYTEFSYMLLQAYDFLELHRRLGVSFQVGGSDQWGNMTAGIELVRRVTGDEAHVLTAPLITTSSGLKFGKSEAGAVYLDADRTSPYQFFQFWINTEDRDVGTYLRFFTLFSREEIAKLDEESAAHPERRVAQQALAMDVTTRVHGPAQAGVAQEISRLLFGGGDPAELSAHALDALRREIPFAEIVNNVGLDEADAAAPDVAADIHSLLVMSGLCASRGEAKKLLKQGGVYLNGRRRTEQERFVREDELLPDRYVLLRKGARSYALVRLRGSDCLLPTRPVTIRVLVTDGIDPEGVALLRADGGLQVDVEPTLPVAALLDRIGDYDAIVGRSATRVSPELLERAKRLKVVGRAGVGVDNIALDAATERGIAVINAPAGNTIAVAELVIGSLIALLRQLPKADATMHAGKWTRGALLGSELRGRRLGIVGLGRIGGEVAARAHAFGMPLAAYDPYVPDERFHGLRVRRCATLDELLDSCDVLTVHTPITPETRGMVGRSQLARLARGAVVCNLARGGIVDEEALLEALSSG